MLSKILRLWIIILGLFPLTGFAQTAEKSAHPLLDKYYPRQESAAPTTTITNPAIPAPQANPLPGTNPVPSVKAITATKPVPVVTDTTVANKPVNTPVPPIETKPEVESQPIAENKPIAEAIPASEMKPVAVETDTTSIVKPAPPSIIKAAPTTVTAPERKVNSGPAPSLYRDTRLGSSTPQYDTWEKNNNGAGSVTTSPK